MDGLHVIFADIGFMLFAFLIPPDVWVRTMTCPTHTTAEGFPTAHPLEM